jgi:hypothetical protein
MLEKFKSRIVDKIKTYEEPEFDKDGKFISKRITKAAQIMEEAGDNGDIDVLDFSVREDHDLMDELRNEMDLPEGCLVTNLFIPTAVVCTKVDLIEHGEKDIKDLLERNLDYIQMNLRKFCLHYGSALVFASNNSNSNIKLIYDYIVSRIYDIDFAYSSNTADKEALFIPTGLDNLELIEPTADLK